MCGACGAGWTLPPVAADELAAYYPPSYGYLGENALQRRVRKTLFGRMVKRRPWSALLERKPGSVLDVGCGRGDLGAALLEHGWRVAGVDPSGEAVAVARQRGIDAHAGTLDTVAFPDDSFDAVVMRHSLEHVPDPVGDLERIRKLLRPGGIIVVSVPNFDSWERRRYGSAWFHLDLPRHRTHFSPKSLCLALEQSGFEVVSTQTAGDAGSLLASLQYRHVGHLMSKSAPALSVQYGLGIVATPVRALLDRKSGGGPVLNVVARRSA